MRCFCLVLRHLLFNNKMIVMFSDLKLVQPEVPSISVSLFQLP